MKTLNIKLIVEFLVNANNYNVDIEDDDTLFQKIYDRLNDFFKDSENDHFISELNILELISTSINNHLEKITKEDDESRGLRVFSLNIKVLGIILSKREVYKSDIELSKSTIQKLLEIVDNENAIVKESALKSLSLIDSKLNIISQLFDYIILTNLIFESFQYPSTFIARSSVDLLSTIYNNSYMSHPQQNITTIQNIIIKYISNQQQDQQNDDIQLCLLDFIINQIHSKSQNETQLNFMIVMIQKVIGLLLCDSRNIRDRVLELISILLDEISNNQLMLQMIVNNSMADYFQSIVHKLLLIPELVSTGIELIGILDITSLFSAQNSLFKDFVNNQFNIKSHDALRSIKRTDDFYYSLFQTTKQIVEKCNSKSISVNLIVNRDYLEWLISQSVDTTLKISHKSIKLLIESLSIINLKHWDLDNNQLVSNLFIKLKSYSNSRLLVKELLNAIYHQILNSTTTNNYPDLYDQLNLLLMNFNGDIRELSLSFLIQIFNNNNNNNEIIEYLLNRSIVKIIISKLSDSDTYVRSSALELIKVISMKKSGWDHLVEQTELPFHSLDQLHINNLQNTKSLDINDNLLNNNKINLTNYTKFYLNEMEGDFNGQVHKIQHSKLSIVDSETMDEDLQSLGSNDSWEWEDSEFRDLLSRTTEEPLTFMNEDSNQQDTQMGYNELNTLLKDYPFPYCVLLFFKDQDSYPRISSIELLTHWLDLEYTNTFFQDLVMDQQVNRKYSMNAQIASLITDSNWEVKLKFLDFIIKILQRKGIDYIVSLDIISLLQNSIKNQLEDKIIRKKSLELLGNIQHVITTIDNYQYKEYKLQLEQFDWDVYREECSDHNQFTQEEQEDISILLLSSDNRDTINKIDCY
ncbi:hypothetical protein DLAC_00406 [Tieghemostelium lacteum]|uniref:Armadillo-like helical domain-containing protein n=1 Tax=Tieghemostelium lacteum TaxID=361077 RepID=A0A152A9M6_TIELA|nr:hypothetical protein DLAC_00406 [Tieghemostelium lacteum]|eukprot:KYR02926.1 hypothetical protein DLAC_00406 [Tieghemostelium lacteum]